jgi:catecholate siderophore receptor
MNRFYRPVGRLTPIALALSALTPLHGFAQQAESAATAPAKPATSVPSTLREVKVQDQQDKNNFGANPVSISRLPAELRDIPQSVTIINQAVMQSQGATSLASALKNVPGLTIGAAEGGTIGTNINLNGFSARTDMYLDGARDRAQYFRDTFALDSVEVLQGPSSMLFGRGSTGGVINQVSKRATLTPSNEVSLSAGTTGLLRATADINRPLSETSALRISAMGQEGDATTRDQTHVKDAGIAGSLRLGINTPTTITFNALLQHNRDMADYGFQSVNGAPTPIDRDRAFGFSNDRTISDIHAFSATVQHKITPTTSIRNQTSYNAVTTDAIETAPQALGTRTAAGVFTPLSVGSSAAPLAATTNLPLSQLWVRQQAHDRIINDKSLFNLTELTTKVETGSIKHALLAGVELGHDTYNNQSLSRTANCGTVNMGAGFVGCTPLLSPSDISPNVPETAGNLATAKADTIAAFINDTLEFSPQWKLVAGVRHDRYRATVNNSIPTATTLATQSQTVSFNSVRLGPIWQPTPQQSYYVSYSTSFNPSLEQLVGTTGATQPLPPQKNKSYELGGKWDLNDGNLSLSSALFQIEQKNARSQASDGTFVATGTIRVNGVRAGVAGKVTDRLNVFAAYTHLDATIVDGIAAGTQGRTPVNTPKDAASLWTIYSVTPEWQVGGGATTTGSRYANNTDLVRVGGYTRFDAMVVYHQPKYDIRLNLFNLANKMFYEALIPSDGGRAVPGSGRSATLTATYRF